MQSLPGVVASIPVMHLNLLHLEMVLNVDFLGNKTETLSNYDIRVVA